MDHVDAIVANKRRKPTTEKRKVLDAEAVAPEGLPDWMVATAEERAMEQFLTDDSVLFYRKEITQ